MGKSAQRKSFILHIDSLDILDDLTLEQAGELFLAIRDHQKGTKAELSQITKIAFNPFKHQFIRDDEKYQALCEKNKKIAINRHSTKSTTRNQALPSVTKSTDNKNKNKNKNKNDNKKIKSKTEKPLLSVQSFVDEGYKEETLNALIEHRKVVVKKPILTDRMMRGLLKSLTEYYQHWQITPDEAIDFYLSKQWVSIDKEYKYPHRVMKQSKPTDSLSYSDIGKMLKEGKTNPTADNKILNLTKKMGV